MRGALHFWMLKQKDVGQETWLTRSTIFLDNL